MNDPCSKRHSLPVCWIALILLDAGLVVVAMAQDRPDTPVNVIDPVITQIDGPANIKAHDVRFEAVDVIVDSGETPLAAWQFEIQSRSPGVEIVGIEGGEHEAFAEPPYYDPKAMNSDRVILAAFSTADELPSGRSRIARLHLQLEGPGPREFEVQVKVMATIDGEPIPAIASLEKSTI
ncbi:MAG: hypothetical protein ABGZ35_06745 [Planctomycetaceae bacterium]|jgi:hypothetical protein